MAVDGIKLHRKRNNNAEKILKPSGKKNEKQNPKYTKNVTILQKNWKNIREIENKLAEEGIKIHKKGNNNTEKLLKLPKKKIEHKI